MYALLDLVWRPTPTGADTPPTGQAPAIVRGDTYVHQIRVTDGWLNDLQDETYSAQIRAERLTGATAADPLAEFDVTLDQDVDDLLIILELTSEQTLALPSKGFWDLQSGDADPITTLLAGKVKVLDDVTRAGGS